MLRIVQILEINQNKRGDDMRVRIEKPSGEVRVWVSRTSRGLSQKSRKEIKKFLLK